MSEIWMDVDTALAEVPVNKVALIDDTDFKSREESVVYNQAGMDLVWNFVTTAGAYTQTAITPTTAGVHDWTSQGNGMYSIEVPDTGGTINNDTEGFGWFTGFATGILPWTGPTIGFRAAALNNALIDGGDLLDVSLLEMGGSAQSATDLKDFADVGYDPGSNQVSADMVAASGGDGGVVDAFNDQYDGVTGLTGDTYPATQSQLGSIANVGSAVHRPAASYTLTTGTQSANTVTETQALDGVRHEHTDTAGVMELYYEFDVGAGIPSSCQVTGYVTGGNDDLDVYGYDWVAAGWVQIGNIQGGGAASNSVNSFNMFINMVGTGANLGIVRVRFYKAAGLTTATLAVDQIFVAYSQSSLTILDRIYFDSGASNTNTVPGTDGVPGNPVSTEAAVNTLLASTNLSQVEVALESSITFATSHTNELWGGTHWDLDMGSQDLDGSHFINADVSGIGTGSVTIDFRNCDIGTATIHPFHMDGCGFSGTLTLGAAGTYVINDGHSAIAGSSTPIIDTGAALANVNLSMPDYHNGTEIRNLNATGTDLFSISGIGQIIYAASSSGAVNQRGNWKVTNTGGVTITADDNTVNLAAVLTDTNELQSDDVPGLIAALNDLSTADILTQVNAALDTAIPELGIGSPTATPTLRTAAILLYMATVNKRDTIAAQDEIHNAAGTPIMDAVLSDDGVTFSKAKYVAP